MSQEAHITYSHPMNKVYRAWNRLVGAIRSAMNFQKKESSWDDIYNKRKNKDPALKGLSTVRRIMSTARKLNTGLNTTVD